MERPPQDASPAWIDPFDHARQPLDRIEVQLRRSMEQGRPGSLLRVVRRGRLINGHESDDRRQPDLGALNDEGVVVELLRQPMQSDAAAFGGGIRQDQGEMVS